MSQPTQAPAFADASTPCPLCDNPNAWLLTQRDRHGDPLRVVMCSQCTLVRIDPLPSAAELEEYYTDDYRADYKGSSSPKVKHIWREFVVAGKRMTQLRKYLKPGTRVIDIGSSLGGVVATLGQRGFEAEGVEPYRDYYEFSRRSFDVKATNCVFTKYSTETPFDLATMFHVMEHVVNFHEVLTHLKTLLAPDGKIFVEVPNIVATGASPQGRYHRAHVLGFSPFTLSLAFQKAGYKVLECGTNLNGENVWIAAQNAENLPAPELRHPNPVAVYEKLHNHTQLGFLLSLRWTRRMARRITWQAQERQTIAGAKTESDVVALVKEQLLKSPASAQG